MGVGNILNSLKYGSIMSDASNVLDEANKVMAEGYTLLTHNNLELLRESGDLMKYSGSIFAFYDPRANKSTLTIGKKSFNIKSVMSGNREGFDLICSAQIFNYSMTNNTKSILDFLKPRDFIKLEWFFGGGTNQYIKDAGLATDLLYLNIKRGNDEYQFTLHQQTTPANIKGRMIQFRDLKEIELEIQIPEPISEPQTAKHDIIIDLD